MQAGRELDKLIGQSFGWNVDPTGTIYRKSDMWFDLPRFSTTWEGMGVLVEEARKQRYGFKLSLHGSCDMATVGTELDGQFKLEAFSHGATAAHAACLAFLKAKGIAI